MTIERIGSGMIAAGGLRLPFSKAVRAGDFVFVSGQIGLGADGEVVAGGIVAETRQTIENVRAILALAHLTLADVVKVTAWLDDTRDFPSFNKVYDEYFHGHLPARSCVRSDLMTACKVEIEAIAFAPRA